MQKERNINICTIFLRHYYRWEDRWSSSYIGTCTALAKVLFFFFLVPCKYGSCSDEPQPLLNSPSPQGNALRKEEEMKKLRSTVKSTEGKPIVSCTQLSVQAWEGWCSTKRTAKTTHTRYATSGLFSLLSVWTAEPSTNCANIFVFPLVYPLTCSCREAFPSHRRSPTGPQLQNST